VSIIVQHLKPGMFIKSCDVEAMVIALVPNHPVWPHLSLVIWKMTKKSHPTDPDYSFDALNPNQVVGTVVYPNDDDVERRDRWRDTIVGKF
jgi:hypothetical protein